MIPFILFDCGGITINKGSSLFTYCPDLRNLFVTWTVPSEGEIIKCKEIHSETLVLSCKNAAFISNMATSLPFSLPTFKLTKSDFKLLILNCLSFISASVAFKLVTRTVNLSFVLFNSD